MSSKTTYLQLEKPDESDFYDINVQNNNMDIIDREINGVKKNITDAWSSSKTYAVGEYCIYNNAMWKCLVANKNTTPSEGATWTKTEIATELCNVNTNLDTLNANIVEIGAGGKIKSYNGDLNDITKTSMYQASGFSSNRPTSNGGYIMTTYSTTTGYLTQQFTDMSNGMIYVRNCKSGVWSNWLKLVTEETGTITSVNESNVVYPLLVKHGRIAHAQAIVALKTGTTLDVHNACCNVSFVTPSFSKRYPCIFRNSDNGATREGHLILGTDGNIYPAETNTAYNEIRFDFSYLTT